MRRILWMGVGAAGAVSGQRWLARTWRRALARRAPAPRGDRDLASGRPGGLEEPQGQRATLRAPGRVGGTVRSVSTVGAIRRPSYPPDQVREKRTLGSGPERSTGVLLGAAGEVVGAGGVLAGRVLARLVGVGVRMAGHRVRWAVEGGKADAMRREQELRRSLDGPGTRSRSSDR